jgi:osmotically-inducible protein OsmY
MRNRWPVFLAALGLAVGLSSAARASATLDDALTNLKVRTALLDRFGTDALGVAIDVNGSNVVLSGHVDRPATRDGAKGVAASVKGVASVENRIALGNGPATRTRAATAKAKRNLRNSLLEARVKGRLLEEVGENAFKIDVHASGGVVTLRGSVPTAPIHATALDTAKGTKGVARVVDELETP